MDGNNDDKTKKYELTFKIVMLSKIDPGTQFGDAFILGLKEAINRSDVMQVLDIKGSKKEIG